MANPIYEKQIDDLKMYIQGVNARISHLEKELFKRHGEQHEQEMQLERTQGALKEEILSLKHDLNGVEDELMQAVCATRELVGIFTNVVRTQEFNALNDRIKSWKGESFIRRDEIQRWISEDLTLPSSAPAQVRRSQPQSASRPARASSSPERPSQER